LARLLVGVHSSVLFAGSALVLAVVLGLVVLDAVRLVGRTHGQEWGRWAEIVLVPVTGVILLGIASLIASRQVPANAPSLISTFVSYVWYAVSHPFSIGTQISLVLVDLLIIGELARFGYLLFQRLRNVKAPHTPGGAAPVVPAWLSIVSTAVVVGLWIAADPIAWRHDLVCKRLYRFAPAARAHSPDLCAGLVCGAQSGGLWGARRATACREELRSAALVLGPVVA
jgi:hypothetical protein